MFQCSFHYFSLGPGICIKCEFLQTFDNFQSFRGRKTFWELFRIFYFLKKPKLFHQTRSLWILVRYTLDYKLKTHFTELWSTSLLVRSKDCLRHFLYQFTKIDAIFVKSSFAQIFEAPIFFSEKSKLSFKNFLLNISLQRTLWNSRIELRIFWSIHQKTLEAFLWRQFRRIQKILKRGNHSRTLLTAKSRQKRHLVSTITEEMAGKKDQWRDLKEVWNQMGLNLLLIKARARAKANRRNHWSRSKLHLFSIIKYLKSTTLSEFSTMETTRSNPIKNNFCIFLSFFLFFCMIVFSKIKWLGFYQFFPPPSSNSKNIPVHKNGFLFKRL